MERSQRYQEALEIYSRLAAEAAGGEAAAIWKRIGELQRRAGEAAASVESFGHAIRLFTDAGQRNNALAVCLELRQDGVGDTSIDATLLDLATEAGFREFAETALREPLRAATRGDADDVQLRRLATFFARFPDRLDPRSGILEEELRLGDQQQTIAFLGRLRSALANLGLSELAERASAEIFRLRPTDEREAWERDGSSDPDPATPPMTSLLEPTSVDEKSGASDIPLLEGLEPTQVSFGEEGDVAVPEPLSAIEHTSAAPPVTADSPDQTEEEEAEDDGEEGDPLPLLVPSERLSPGTAEAGGVDGTDRGSAAPDDLPPDLDIDAITAELGPVASRPVEAADPASHYDVGVAFKEMGMIDDAISRLTAALAGGHNPLATLEVLGEVLVSRGSNEVASRVLRHARSGGAEADEALVGVLYWLARSEEALGRSDDARELFARIVSVAPDFLDAADRLAGHSPN